MVSTNERVPRENRTRRLIVREFFTKYGITLVLILVCVSLSIASDVFLTLANLTNVARQISYTMIVAFGMTTLFICGLNDLSPGAVMALTGVFAADMVVNQGQPLVFAILVALAVGGTCGFISGYIITTFNLPAFIVTMAMQAICRGIVLAYTTGYSIMGVGDAFKSIGQGIVCGVPIPILIALFIGAITWIMLNKTRIGRHIYAIGGNAFAATAAGIKVKWVQIGAMVYSGVLAAIAGIVLTARLNCAQPTMADSVHFDAMTGAIIGGTSMRGGSGTVYGTIIGSILMGVLNNMLNLMAVNAYYQQIVRGAVIIIAIIIDSVSKRSKT